MMILWMQNFFFGFCGSWRVQKLKIRKKNTPVFVNYSNFHIHAHDPIQFLIIGFMFKKQRDSSFLRLVNAILFFFSLKHHIVLGENLSFKFYFPGQKSHIITEETHLTSTVDIILKNPINQMLFFTINFISFQDKYLLCKTQSFLSTLQHIL